MGKDDDKEVCENVPLTAEGEVNECMKDWFNRFTTLSRAGDTGVLEGTITTSVFSMYAIMHGGKSKSFDDFLALVIVGKVLAIMISKLQTYVAEKPLFKPYRKKMMLTIMLLLRFVHIIYDFVLCGFAISMIIKFGQRDLKKTQSLIMEVVALLSASFSAALGCISFYHTFKNRSNPLAY